MRIFLPPAESSLKPNITHTNAEAIFIVFLPVQFTSESPLYTLRLADALTPNTYSKDTQIIRQATAYPGCTETNRSG